MHRIPAVSLLTSWIAVAMVAAIASGPALAQEPTHEPPLRVHCPAIEVDDNPESEDPSEPNGPVHLAVLGTAREIGEGEEHWDKACEIAIERTLYGSAGGTSVRATRCRNGDGGKKIFELVRDPYSDDYRCLHVEAAEEEQAIRALCEARLDLAALSSECILVGRMLTAGDDFDLTIRVIRGISGPAIPADTVLKAQSPTYMRTGGKLPKVRTEPEIYFFSSVAEDRKTHEKTYYVSTSLPADQEKSVVAALGHRGDYPIETIEHDGRRARVQEITLRGTVAEAIALLGSGNDAAVSLGARFLIRRGHAIVADVVGAIEKEQQVFEKREYRGYRKLHNLARILGLVKGGEEAIGKLILRTLDRVAGDPPALPEEQGGTARRWGNREDDEQFNHSLAWLLLELPEERVGAEFGERLLKLRDGAKAGWKEELQIAIDACHVEDNIEIAEASKRMKGVVPARSVARPRIGTRGTCRVRFSPGGRFMAVGTRDGSVTIVRTSDWVAEATLDPARAEWLFEFASDESRIFLAGGRDECRVSLVEWKTGKTIRTFATGGRTATALEFSGAGRVVMASNYYDDEVTAWDSETGERLRNWFTPQHDCEHAISPDGRFAAVPVEKGSVSIDEIRGKEHHTAALVKDEELAALAWTPNGEHLLTLSLSWKTFGRTRTLRVLHATTDYTEVGTVDLPANRGDCAFAVSAKGDWVVVGERQTLWAIPFPALKPVREFRTNGGGDIDEVSFAPDGSLLAVAAGDGFPQLFKGPEFTPFLPFEGHRNAPDRLYFSADGKSLVTIESDGPLCRWDASTMALQRRSAFPDGLTIVSVRPPDAKFGIGFPAAEIDRLDIYQPGHFKASILDLDTMECLRQIELPATKYDLQFCWVDDRLAVIFTGKETCVFDYQKGTIVKRADAPTGRSLGRSLLAENPVIWSFGASDIRMGTGALRKMDLDSFAVTEVGEVRLDRLTGNTSGIAPGGRCYIGDPGMYIFDLKSLKPVSARDFRDRDLLEVAFDATGDRYAVVTGGRIFINNNFQELDPKTTSIIRVHDTRTGRTLLAWPASTRWIRAMAFSPSGDRLAIVNEDATIETWPLPR